MLLIYNCFVIHIVYIDKTIDILKKNIRSILLRFMTLDIIFIMTTIIKIKYIESNNDEVGQSNISIEREMLVNINCPIKMILSYIRKVAHVNNTYEFDLCDEVNCQLKNISLYEPFTCGTDILQSDSTYFIITFERDENGQMINFTPLLTGKAAKRCCDILSKVRRSSRKTSSIKSTPKKINN